MFLKLARSLAKPQAVAILDLIKRSSGLSVNELAKLLKLSYMGTKQYCDELEKKGVVDKFRRPKEKGRPDMLYRLTEKAEAFYPEVGNELSIDLLEAAQQLYGPSAPDKLLFHFFNKKAEVYLKKLKGTTLVERARALANLREAEGYCAQIEMDGAGGLRLVEFHSLLKNVSASFPNVGRLEELMLGRVLGAPVQREEKRVSGLVKTTFVLAVGEAVQPMPERVEEETENEEPETVAKPKLVAVVEEVTASIEQSAESVEVEEECVSFVWNMLPPPLIEQIMPEAATREALCTPDNILSASQKQLAPTPVEPQELFEEFRLVG